MLTPLTRSADAGRILLSWVGFYQGYRLYVAERDTFLPRGSFLINGYNYGGEIPAISLSASGHRFLIKGNLFDDTGRERAYLDPPGHGWVSALSPGGDTAYFGFGVGILRTRLADGATFERVLLPEVPTRIDVLPGGARLLVRGPEQADGSARVYLVQLNAVASRSAARTTAALAGAWRVRTSVRLVAAGSRAPD